MIGFLSLAIDITKSYSERQRLQDTTDAIVLLAAKDKSLDTPEKLQVAAQALYDATYPGETGLRIEIESIVREGDEVTIISRNTVDTFFTGVFDKSSLDVSVKSQAIFSRKSLDVALVLDSTGSMGRPVTGRTGPSRISGLKTAANGLIDLVEDLDNSDVRLSVVPFAQYVNVGEIRSREGWLDFSETNQNDWNGCVGSRVNGFDETPNERGGAIPTIAGNLCPTEIQPLTSNMTTSRRSIDALTPRGLTYIPSGITWGWRTLEGEIPARVQDAPANTDHQKVMVIMTDGANTRSKSDLTHDGRDINDANDKTADLCESVKNDDIEVYTIAYALNNEVTRDLLQDCVA